MKILIAGGAGFIGASLVRRLLKEGHDIHCLDNFYTGRKENITELEDNKNFTLINHDITQPYKTSEKYDQIYNLACPASPPKYQKDPIYTTKVNFLGTLNLLELAKDQGARFFQASTSEIYGDPLEHPQKETYRGNVNTLGPRACYDEGKRVAESLVMDFNRFHKVDVRIVRIFNTYGPFMDPEDGRVISNFILQSLRGEQVTIFGDGEQTRTPLYVDDLVEGFIRFMNQDGFTGPVNLGGTEEYSIKEIAEKIIEKIEGKSDIVFKDLPTDDPLKRKPDISLAKDKLDWEPIISFDDGLLKTVDYFRKYA